MGRIHKEHGRIAIETRSEGFVVHAGYGYKVGAKPISELKPGTVFLATDPQQRHEPGGIGLANPEPEKRAWRLRALYESNAEAVCEQTSVVRSFALTLEVQVPGTEVFDEDEPLAKAWQGAHPEFAFEDLDDLIAALTEVKNSKRRNR